MFNTIDSTDKEITKFSKSKEEAELHQSHLTLKRHYGDSIPVKGKVVVDVKKYFPKNRLNLYSHYREKGVELMARDWLPKV